MLETLRFSKVFRNLAEVRDGNPVALTHPFLYNGGDAPFREAQPENAASQIIGFRIIHIIARVFGADGARRQQPRHAPLAASPAHTHICILQFGKIDV